MIIVAIVGIVGIAVLGIVAIVCRSVSKGKLRIDGGGITFEAESGKGTRQAQI